MNPFLSLKVELEMSFHKIEFIPSLYLSINSQHSYILLTFLNLRLLLSHFNHKAKVNRIFIKHFMTPCLMIVYDDKGIYFEIDVFKHYYKKYLRINERYKKVAEGKQSNA